MLIGLGNLILRVTVKDPQSLNPSKFLDEFETRLGTNEYFGGSQTTRFDIALFGHAQCLSCGLSDKHMAEFMRRKPLAAWIKRMNVLFHDYPRLHSRRCDPAYRASGASPTTKPSLGLRLTFACSMMVMLLFFPLTFPVLIIMFVWRYINPERSCRRISRL